MKGSGKLACIAQRIAAVAAGALLGLVAIGPAAGADASTAPLVNAFDDPFFQITDARPGCPLPLGPLVTDAERRSQAHARAERGTSCWLAGECERASAYAYDRPIADTIRARLAATPRFAGSSLWVTVQRRFVFVEGCVPAPAAAAAAEIEAFVRGVPEVQMPIVNVYAGPPDEPPYRVRPR